MDRTLLSSSVLFLALTACTQSALQASGEGMEAVVEDPGTHSVESPAPADGLVVATTESSYGQAPIASEPAPLEEPISAPLEAPVLVAEAENASQDEPLGELEVEEVRSFDAAPPPPAQPQGARLLDQAFSGKLAASGSAMSTRRPAGHAQRARPDRRVAHSAPPSPPVNTEAYTDYGVNDMTETAEDRFSTFSIDVDTASYTIARRKLREGRLPPEAAVRVEEFINYFPYSYTPPETEAPFAVHMEAAPDPFNQGHHLFRVGIKAQEADLSDRKPVHLTFLVDVSGSMNRADKLGLAKRSLNDLVNELQPGDTVALATYAGRVRAILNPTDVVHKSQILGAIQDLSANGSTAMNSGIQLAYQMAQESYVQGHENRVIVLSDGDANVGPSTHAEILRSIKGYAQQGITLSTIGFGMGNYKDTMMEQLANNGDGNYYYIDSYSESKKVFGTDLAGTLQVVAKDVKIQVEFNPESVSTYRLVGYENRDIADRDFRNDTVDAGEIGTGHTVTALYELVLNEEANSELATVRIRNKKPGPESPAVEWMTTYNGSEIRPSLRQASQDFQIAIAAASFAEILRNSPYAADIGWADLSRLAAEAQRPGVAEDDELLSLIQRAASLRGARGPTAVR